MCDVCSYQIKIHKEDAGMAQNYLEIAGYGRGAGTDHPYTIAFELSIKTQKVDEGIRRLSTKSGLAVKKINGGGKPLSGFINITEINTMKERVKYAQQKIIEAMCNPAVAVENEYVFRMGTFKGKTPSQLLLEGVPEADLLAQRDFLGKNATGKFAEINKKGIADIDTAIAKFKAGTLKASDAKSSVIPLFKSGPRYFVQKKPQPYETEGWELTITCNPYHKNPFSIEWQSKRVTIDKNVIVAAKDVKIENAALTEVEFIDMWDTTIKKLNKLENEDLVQRIQYAETISYKNNSNNDTKNNDYESTHYSSSYDDDMPFK